MLYSGGNILNKNLLTRLRIPLAQLNKTLNLTDSINGLFFRGVNYPAHKQQTVGCFMVNKKEERPVNGEGFWHGVWCDAHTCGCCCCGAFLIHLNHCFVQNLNTNREETWESCLTWKKNFTKQFVY